MGAGLIFIFGLVAFVGFGVIFFTFRIPRFGKSHFKYRKRKEFSRLEEKVIDEFLNRFERNSKSRLKKQISQMTVKHKFYKDESLLIEFRTENLTAIPDDILLDNKAKFNSEIVNFKIKNGEFESWLTFFGGQVCEMIIIPNPKRFERSDNVSFTRI